MSHAKKNLNHQLIAQFSGQQSQITIPKLYYKLTKNLNKALLLNQIVFYSDKSTYCKDGWFYKPYSEWMQEVFLSERTLRDYFKELDIQDGFIEMRSAKVKGVKCLFCRPRMENITNAIICLLEKEQMEGIKESGDEQHLPYPAISAVLEENCPIRQKLPDGYPAEIAGSNTIYTDKTTDNTTTSNSQLFEGLKHKELSILQNGLNNSEQEKMKTKFREDSLSDEKCISVFKSRFATTDVTLEQLYSDCCDYWSQKNQMVFKARFLTHLTKCPISNYPEKKSLEQIKKQKLRVQQSRQQEIERELETKKRLSTPRKASETALGYLSEIKRAVL